ncbi:hypothetical protein HGG72_08340 [Ochrobactrum pecoris]|uniref:Uncharacterized protein n=1 Tax=Brucella pecoris TaxID=867683 RepID=A0A5C5CRY6_9HYPH|nr:hypothetical protein [Brucella pecoris]KAB2699353.1 hypothetical protein F9K79_09675 [Ochrobactrum sp. Kaboul]MCH4539092.1 hypothetical protein [Ochrobactrum sp. A-1]MBB4092434.1 hypothetical protein [Brucella pecoris]NKW80348.1 hypothetical protein [Brucella pecoris]TNV14280.1 hypothetical protein FIB18_03305 [Brucella pecoris]
MSERNHPSPVRFLLIPVLGDIKEERFTVARATVVPRAKLLEHVRTFFDEPIERVNVLYRGEYRDMFVGETSSINDRHIRNIRATEIYRNNVLSNGWEPSFSNLPFICGPAVLFPDYQVWK